MLGSEVLLQGGQVHLDVRGVAGEALEPLLIHVNRLHLSLESYLSPKK